jgi:integrase
MLKTYLLVLASGGMRATECLAIRREYAKTRKGREVYISDEATLHLNQWIQWKYENINRPRKRSENDLVFTVYSTADPMLLYDKILREFQKILTIVGLDEKKKMYNVVEKSPSIHSDVS